MMGEWNWSFLSFIFNLLNTKNIKECNWECCLLDSLDIVSLHIYQGIDRQWWQLRERREKEKEREEEGRLWEGKVPLPDMSPLVQYWTMNSEIHSSLSIIHFSSFHAYLREWDYPECNKRLSEVNYPLIYWQSVWGYECIHPVSLSLFFSIPK